MTQASSTRDTEYTKRWEAICRERSLTKAAEALGVKRATLTKWYHMHRSDFPDSIQDAIRSNTGRYPSLLTRTVDNESWKLRKPTEEDHEELDEVGVRSPANFVDALFARFQELKEGYEQCMSENRRLQEENARLRGKISSDLDVKDSASRMRMRSLIEDVTRNSRGGV